VHPIADVRLIVIPGKAGMTGGEAARFLSFIRQTGFENTRAQLAA